MEQKTNETEIEHKFKIKYDQQRNWTKKKRNEIDCERSRKWLFVDLLW